MDKKRRIKKIITNKKLKILIVITFFLLLLELLLVLMVYEPYPLCVYRYDNNTAWSTKENVSLNYSGYPEFGVNKITTNERGERMTIEKEGLPTVLVVGDSFSFGVGVDDEESIPYLLDEKFSDYDFINAGVPGFNFYQITENSINKMDEVNPDVLLFFVYWGNDFKDSGKKYSEKKGFLENGYILGKSPSEYGLTDYLNNNFRIFKYSKNFIYSFVKKNELVIDNKSFSSFSKDKNSRSEDYNSLLNDFSRIKKKTFDENVSLFLIFVPSKHFCFNELDNILFSFYKDSFYSFLEDENVSYFDGTVVFDCNNILDYYYVNDGHFNFKGNNFFADNLSYYLKNEGVFNNG